MKTTITIIMFAACALLTGCKGDTFWVLKYEPTTEAERAAVAKHVEAVLRATPATLSGHDQDWDDAIEMAHRQARQSLCRPTFWEKEDFGPYIRETGRWRYADAPQDRAK